MKGKSPCAESRLPLVKPIKMSLVSCIKLSKLSHWLLNLPSMTHGLSSLVSTQVGKETAEKTSPKRKT